MNIYDAKRNINTTSTDEGTTEIDDIFDIYSSFQYMEESNSSSTTEEAYFSTKE
ncbi:13554_t:CDS:2 [Funneliformis mosseae]|uniref:13554_t:CDS:1 n=1 Tax=Funneliformis mosseae TaxID=27381 RepID=A0A9N9AGG6_FUNMO|nr:13554_t:CDS:2 [Funneliformis mosseae]